MIEQSFKLLAPLAQQRGMRLALTQTGPVPTVLADSRSIRQVLFNLLGNDIKFANPDSLVRVDLQHLAGAPMVVMAVQDEGPGMSPDRLAGLFQPFPAGHRGGDAPSGTGLGLAISQRLVEAMGGRIDVRSLPGQGTCFSVRLPADGRAAAPPVEALETVVAETAPAVQPQGNACVLYIEDNPVNALLMAAVFGATELAHLRLVIAVNGHNGLQQARQLLPGLILLDMQLPDIDGAAALQALKSEARTAAIPVIALSADAVPAQVQSARAAGCQDYWTKPLDLQKVLAEMTSRFPPPLY